MNSIVVCASRSHGNTRRVAETMAAVLDARVVAPTEVDAADLVSYDLVGFGSGVYAMTFDGELSALIDALPPGEGCHVFVFATSGAPELPWLGFTRPVCRTLESKGYLVDGSFTCRGWDTWGPLGCIGGVNRGHPDDGDLRRAERFATGLRDRLADEPANGAGAHRVAS